MKLFYEKYIKLAHIGKGANAHVYQVRHAELGYVRAIKILNDYIEKKSDRPYQSFLKECKTLLAIGNGSHPNIVRIYGPDLIDNRAIVEMDYIQGVTLDSYIKDKGFLEYDEIKTFIHDIVGALAYTHHDIYKFLMNPEEDDLQVDPNNGKKFLISTEKEAELVKKYGIAHNDLHSNNVMRRDYDGSFVLLDFGLAVQDGECIKSSRKSDGSPEYKAPEKFDSGEITPRSDVYSLGVLIYEALTGRPPFVLEVSGDGKVSYPSLSKICNEHHNQTPPEILPLRKAAFERQIPGAVYERDYPEWLDKVVMTCLAKNPEDRYSDAKELLDDINWHISHEIKTPPHTSPDITIGGEAESEPMSSSDSKNVGDQAKAQPLEGSSPAPAPTPTATAEEAPKAKKKNLLYIGGAAIAILLGCAIFYVLDKKEQEIVSAKNIYIPIKEYQLTVGDSVVIEGRIDSHLAEDTIITWAPYDSHIVAVKGDTIIALNTGETVINASIPKYTVDSAVKVTVMSNTDNQSGDNSSENNIHLSNDSSHKQDVSKKEEPKKEEALPKPIVDNAQTGSKKTESGNKRQSPSIDLGYGIWHGASKNGKPHGKGKLVFSSSHKVYRHSDVIANPGDYFEAVYENGQLVNGSLFDSSGNKKNTIVP